MHESLPVVRGERAYWDDICVKFRRWHAAQDPSAEPYSVADIGAVLAAVCPLAGIEIVEDGTRVYCVDRKVL